MTSKQEVKITVAQKGGRRRSGETNRIAATVIQARGEDGLEKGWRSGNGEKVPNLGYILEIYLTGVTGGLGMWCKEKQISQDESKIFLVL